MQTYYCPRNVRPNGPTKESHPHFHEPKDAPIFLLTRIHPTSNDSKGVGKDANANVGEIKTCPGNEKPEKYVENQLFVANFWSFLLRPSLGFSESNNGVYESRRDGTDEKQVGDPPY